VSIRDLKTFLAIAEGGSFASAARAVRRTQSAVSTQMKALEEELGIDLFDRSKRPPLLTDAGRAFVPKIADVVQAYELLFQRTAGSELEGRIRLGSVPTLITGRLPRALMALRSKYPRLRIELTMGLSADLVEKLRRGALDAALISEWQEGSAELQWTPFAREPLVLIAPPDAPPRRAEELVTTLPFIRYTREAWVGHLIDLFLKKRRLKVDEVMTLDTLEAITTMVHHGLGVSIVPHRTRSHCRSRGSPLRVRRFTGPSASCSGRAIRRRRSPKAFSPSSRRCGARRSGRRGGGAARARRSRGGGALPIPRKNEIDLRSYSFFLNSHRC
jgi:DNA-binding transcriptional LysR family regulator